MQVKIEDQENPSIKVVVTENQPIVAKILDVRVITTGGEGDKNQVEIPDFLAIYNISKA